MWSLKSGQYEDLEGAAWRILEDDDVEDVPEALPEGARGRVPEGEQRRGWLLRLRVNKQGLVSWDTAAYHCDDEGLPHLTPEVPSPAGTATARTQ